MPTSAASTHDIVSKLWNHCNVLKDDGVTYHQYVTELTYLLFLKMAKETGQEQGIPEEWRWDELEKLDGTRQLNHYKLQHTEGNAAARRALRLVLAEQQGPLELAQEVRKRLAAVERSSSWLDQKRRDALLADLDRQRQAMVGTIATHDPDLAVELLWLFLDLASSLQDRCDCSDEGELPLFHQASADLGQGACRAKGSTAALAEQVGVTSSRRMKKPPASMAKKKKMNKQPMGMAPSAPLTLMVVIGWLTKTTSALISSLTSTQMTTRLMTTKLTTKQTMTIQISIPTPTTAARRCAWRCWPSPMPWGMRRPIWRSIAITSPLP